MKLKRKRLPKKILFSSDGSTVAEDDPIEEVGDSIIVKKPIAFPKSLQQSDTLLDRHCPILTKDLAVHKKKIEQVRQWLKLEMDKPRILLLSGPVGSGKTAVLKCLSKELGLSVKEFNNEINTNSLNFEDGQYVSVISGFIEQIRCCIKSASLSFQNGQDLSSPSSLLLLEDLPNISNSGTKQKLHEALNEYIAAREASSPIVIILSDTTFHNASFSNDTPITKSTFIPINVLKSSRFAEISFNPIAKSFVVKTLKQICQREGFKSRTTDLIEDIAVNCEGDIRKAINYLQFYGLKSTLNSKAQLNREEISMYHILGKIIYNKREDTMDSAESQLDGTQEHHKRKLLSFDPEVVVQRGQLSHSTLSLFLLQNYTSQANTLEEVIQASEYLSLSDIYAGYWDSENAIEKYAVSVASRGILFSWDPILPRKASGYKGFIKPEYWNARRTETEFKRSWLEELYPGHLQSYYSSSNGNSQDRELKLSSIPTQAAFQQLLPFLGVLNGYNFSLCKLMPVYERKYISKICSYYGHSKESSFYENDDWQEPVLDSDSPIQPTNGSKNNMQSNFLHQNYAVLADDDIEEL